MKRVAFDELKILAFELPADAWRREDFGSLIDEVRSRRKLDREIALRAKELRAAFETSGAYPSPAVTGLLADLDGLLEIGES